MAGFGFGFGFRASGADTTLSFVAGTPSSRLTPHDDWTGTAGSGFETIPQDPERTSAKPALRLLTPPWQWFADGDTTVVGVAAAANDGGTLLNNLGIERVIAHYEGERLDIVAPSYRTITDANGQARTYLGWWTELENDGRYGAAHLYFEAVPHDASMQRRVIGPYSYRPNATKYTHEIVIAPSQPVVAGASYQDMRGAMGYLRAQNASKINPLLRFAEPFPSGEWEGAGAGFNLNHMDEGWLNIVAEVPITFTQTTGQNFFVSPANGIHVMGENITFDQSGSREIYWQPGWPGHGHWFDGCKLRGSLALVEKEPDIPGSAAVRNFGTTDETTRPWFTEVVFEELGNAGVGAALARGCAAIDCFIDLYTGAKCVVGTVAERFSFQGFRDRITAMRINYSGTEPTATIQVTGAPATNNRAFIARWGGNSETLTLANSAGGSNFSFSDIVDWVNTTLAAQDSGWSASLEDDTRKAVQILNSNDLSTGYPQTSCKDIDLAIEAAFDVHGDWFQQVDNGTSLENVILYDNRGFDMEGQVFLIGGNVALRDTVIFNNAFSLRDNEFAPNQFSQFASSFEHCIFAHNSLVNQGVYFRIDGSFAPDGYSLFANNYADSISWISSPAVTSYHVSDNHVPIENAGGASNTIPEGAVGTIIAGLGETLFPMATAGSFEPAGELLLNLKQPVLPSDLNGQSRSEPSAVGALGN